MVVEFQLVPEDIITYEIYCAHNVPAIKAKKLRTRLIWSGITIILFGIVIWLFSAEANVVLRFFILWLSIASLIILLNHLLFLDYTIKRIVQKGLRKGRYNAALVLQKLSIDPEAYTIFMPGAEIKRFWSSLYQICTTEQYAYFFAAETYAYIIPKRVFPDSTAFDELIRLAQQYHRAATDKTSNTN